MANCEKVSASLRDKLGNLSPLSFQHTIYRVPDNLKMGKTECYEPSVVSIGPLYHQLPSVQVMQEHKLRYLQVFLDHGNRWGLDEYVNMLRNWEERIRMCYEENIDLSRDEFMEMMLLDSSFIVAFFLTCAGIIHSEEARVLKRKLYQSLPEIKRDLFLAENQVPFFVVEGLCEMAFDKQRPEYACYDIVSAIINAANMIGIYVSYMDPSTTKQKLEASNIEHLLDLLRRTCLPSSRSAQHPLFNNAQLKLPSAVQLHAAGVKFVAGVGGNLLDIQFRNGVLVIPKIQIEDASESLFRSLVAFELKYCPCDCYFVDYMKFLDDLINTREDVQILVRKGIIDNWIGSDEAVANLFNTITTNVPVNSSIFCYSDIYAGLNAYADIKWNKWKAILKRNYFNHPWAIISVIYAFVLLVLTALQTIKS